MQRSRSVNAEGNWNLPIDEVVLGLANSMMFRLLMNSKMIQTKACLAIQN